MSLLFFFIFVSCNSPDFHKIKQFAKFFIQIADFCKSLFKRLGWLAPLYRLLLRAGTLFPPAAAVEMLTFSPFFINDRPPFTNGWLLTGWPFNLVKPFDFTNDGLFTWLFFNWLLLLFWLFWLSNGSLDGGWLLLCCWLMVWLLGLVAATTVVVEVLLVELVLNAVRRLLATVLHWLVAEPVEE